MSSSRISAAVQWRGRLRRARSSQRCRWSDFSTLDRPTRRRTACATSSSEIALAGTRRDGGVTVAEVSLKPVWDVVAQMKVGERGIAYVVDARGWLIAHPVPKLARVRAALGGRTSKAARCSPRMPAFWRRFHRVSGIPCPTYLYASFRHNAIYARPGAGRQKRGSRQSPANKV